MTVTELKVSAALLGGLLVGLVLATAGLWTLTPTPALHGTAGELAAIALRNGSFCLVILALSLSATAARPGPRLLIETLLLGALAPILVIAGVMLAHPQGPRYFPHAPLELAAIALSVAWLLRHHDHPATRSATASRAALVMALVSLAAAAEVFLVPHVSV